MTTLKEKLARYSEVRENGCVIWTGGVSKGGYGNVRDDEKGVQISAHRAAYKLANGEIPRGMFVCHRCDEKLCINPDHLFAGTPAENSNDMKMKGRSPKTWQRLTDEQYRQIAEDGRKGREIAEEFGIHLRHVFRIKSRFQQGVA
jgi:hypothetical protein